MLNIRILLMIESHDEWVTAKIDKPIRIIVNPNRITFIHLAAVTRLTPIHPKTLSRSEKNGGCRVRG
jgi:hypothetical protein